MRLHATRRISRLLIAGYCLTLLACTARASADEEQSADFLRQHKFFEQYCYACHRGEQAKGDVRIDLLSSNFDDQENRARWLDVVEQLNAKTMPPEGKPRPADADVKILTEWIDRRVAAAENARRASQGRAVMRRLNQTEYQNTVRDLLNIDLDLQGVLPVDTAAGEFDTSAESLHMSSYQLRGYLTAADQVLDAAIVSGSRPPLLKRRIELKNDPGTRRHGVYRHLDDGVAIFASDLASNIQLVFWNFQTRHRGKYRYRISAYAYQSDRPVLFHVNGGTNNLGEPPYLINYFEAPPGKPTVIEFVEQMEAGRNIRLLVDTAIRPRDLERQGGGSQLSRPWSGCPVGRDRRTAARFLAAVQSSAAVRRSGAGSSNRQPGSPRGRFAAAAGRCRADPPPVRAARLPAAGYRRGPPAFSRPFSSEARRGLLVRASAASQPEGRARFAEFPVPPRNHSALRQFGLTCGRDAAGAR